MDIAIGCDHRGLDLKRHLIGCLAEMGHTPLDMGCYDEGAVDYPDIAAATAGAVAQGRCRHGILICATGIGMSMAANKVPGVRAALCHQPLSASRSREHNDANVLCLGASGLGEDVATDIVKAYLEAEFEGGRHAARVEKIRAIESSTLDRARPTLL
ncbi:MAG: ribose 5-phosphate isomerase B [Chloroflexota bacterium]|nr:ribose 5-phosphate isomerase B [Chloroflexota bacterium]